MIPLVWGQWARRIVVCAGCCLLFLAVAAPASAGKVPVRAEREVTVGVPRSFPPYYQLDEDGKPSGFAVAVMNEVARRAGFKVTYRVAENGGANFKAIRAGDIDIIPSLGISDHRKQFVAFTHPVDTFRIVLFVRDDTQGVTGIDDLKGRPVAVVSDNVGYRFLEKRADIQLRVFPHFRYALFALLSAEVDAFAYPEPVTWKLAREAGVSDQIRAAAKPLLEIKRAMAVRKDRTEVLAALDRAVGDFVASPEYQQLYVAWFGKPDPFWTAVRVAWAMGGVLAVLLATIVGWHTRSVMGLNRALRENEAWLMAVIECSPGEIVIRNREGRNLMVNQTFVDWYGVDRDEIIGKTMCDYLPPEILAEVAAQEREVLETGKIVQTERRVTFRDGVTRDIFSQKFPIFAADGDCVAVGTIGVEITKRKQAETALRESEQRFRSVIDNSPSFITLKDTDGRFELVNRKHAEMFGLDARDVVGKIVFDYFPEKLATEAAAQDRKVIETKSVITEERRIFVKRETRDFLVIKFPILDGAGEVIRIGTIGTDVSERKRAETKRRESEERLRRAVIDAPIPIMIHAEDGEVLMISQQWTDLTGYTHAEIPTIAEWTRKAYGEGGTVEKTRERIGALYGIEEKTGEGEYYITTKSGKSRTWDFRSSPLGNLSDGRSLVISMAIDITERKQIEGALRETRAKLDDAVESFSDGFIIYDADDRLVFANDAYLDSHPAIRGIQVPGMKFAEIIRQLAAIGFYGNTPEEIETCVQTRLQYYRSGKPFEYRMENGRWYEMKEYETRDGGIALVRSDITARKRAEDAVKASEARLAEIFDIAPEAVITVGADMTIQLFNQGAERIFGYKSHEVLERSLEILMPESFRSGHQRHVDEFDRSGDTYRLMEHRREIVGLRKDGAEFPAWASVSKLEVAGEKIFTIILRDVTERQRAEEDRRKALVEAERANQAKSEFLATMSHELRTPLNAILGFSDILSRQYFGPIGERRYVEYAEDIHSSGEHLLSLVNDLLDISTIEAGKQSLAKEKLATGEVVAECLHIVANNARDKGIELVARTPENLPPLHADRRAIRQILLNLLSNAIKFTPDGGRVTISIKASRKKTTFAIADTGRGIPAKDLPDLTNPFNRVEQDPYKSVEGWGLGLAITKSLVDLHDGEMGIKSAVGKGSTVTVTIPNGAP